MTSIVAAGLLALLAQGQEDPVDRQVQRLKESLQLSDDQAAKVKDIVKKQNEDLRTVLTDDQKRRYEEMLSGRGGRGSGGGGGNTQGFQGFRGGLPPTEELKTTLGLTDDQVTKINAVRDAAREEIRNLFRNRQPGGNPAEEFQKLRESTNAKIREQLTDDQKPKFDEVVKTSQDQGQNQGGQGRGGRGGSSIDDRVGRVMETLRVEKADEADAIKTVVKKVLEAMDKLEAYQRDSRNKIDELSRNREVSDEAVGDKIEELRKGGKDLEKELAGARQQLAEIVTNRQELELLRRGILR